MPPPPPSPLRALEDCAGSIPAAPEAPLAGGKEFCICQRSCCRCFAETAENCGEFQAHGGSERRDRARERHTLKQAQISRTGRGERGRERGEIGGKEKE